MTKRLLFLSVILALSFFSCRSIRGSGNIIERQVDISGVTAIDLSGVGIAHIRIGDTESLTIKGDDNIIEKMDIDVHGRTLELGRMKDHFAMIRPSEKIEYFVTVRHLEEIGVSGSGKVEVEDKVNAGDFEISVSGSGEIVLTDLRADELKVHISGSGDCSAGGAVKKVDIKISGSGRFKAQDMESQEARCRVSGSGKIELRVSDFLDADVSGSGDIYYWGRPRLNIDTSGSGKVKNRGE